MPKTNPSREIAFILALAVAFAAGLYAYISSSIERPKPPVLVATAAVDATAPPDNRPDDSRRVAGVFVPPLPAARNHAANLTRAAAYRHTTPLSAFRAACTASPFLSTAVSVSIARTREERAPGQVGRGSLSASGVLVSRSGTVDAIFYFVDDPAGVAIVNVNLAGAPVLPMGSGGSGVGPDAGVSVKKKSAPPP
jgi:hypothetical protein